MFDLAKLQPLPFDFEGNYGNKTRSKAFIQQRIRAMREAQASFKGSFIMARLSSSSLDGAEDSEPNSPAGSHGSSRSQGADSLFDRNFDATPSKVERVTLDLLMRQHREKADDRLMTGKGLLGRRTKSFAVKKNPSLVLDDSRSFSTNTPSLLRRSSSFGKVNMEKM